MSRAILVLLVVLGAVTPRGLLAQPPREAGAEVPATGDEAPDGSVEADRAPAVEIENAESAAEAGAAAEPGELWVEANRAYEEGGYGAAAEGYRALVDAGFGGAQVRYNLGNALLRDGRLGAAIASYRRAAVLAPREEDLEANLRFARESARDALEPPGPGALRRTLFFWHYSLSWDETLRAAILVELVLFGALAARIRRRDSEPLRWLAGGCGVVLVALIGSLAARWALPLRVAVVLPVEVEARSGTDRETVVRFKLHAGTEVQVVQERPDWVRIALPDGEQGWLSADQVEVLSDLR